jgi:hypothetical protein
LIQVNAAAAFCDPFFAGNAGEVLMPADATDAIEAGIRCAFTTYSRDDDPDWRSLSWIKPDECAHLTKCILRELAARGLEIVPKKT